MQTYHQIFTNLGGDFKRFDERFKVLDMQWASRGYAGIRDYLTKTNGWQTLAKV